jgi:hypothetical protein
MAYLKEMGFRCDAAGCPKRAVVELCNRRNASLGHYCRSHGNGRLKEQQRLEDLVAAREIERITGRFKP